MDLMQICQYELNHRTFQTLKGVILGHAQSLSGLIRLEEGEGRRA